jgi:hypothetical protein
MNVTVMTVHSDERLLLTGNGYEYKLVLGVPALSLALQRFR